ncbi:collagen alpha-1(I) chain-like [Canis lupus dingo]|uniref:collagen alpha-1(I) chain-like n=1 Tax=Canis lupus dingo TaxID=286419 RepID=UPI000DC69CB9|nr:collagen alpha-1(I) chain-like [Canis lupus dingo]
MGSGPGAGASSLKRASKKAQPPESHPSEGDGACGVPGSPPTALPQGAAGGPGEALYGQNHPAELAPHPLRLYFGPGRSRAGWHPELGGLARIQGSPSAPRGSLAAHAAVPQEASRTEARPRLACCGPPRASPPSVRPQGLGAPPRCCPGQRLFHGWPRLGLEQLPRQDPAQPIGSRCVWAPGDPRPGSASRPQQRSCGLSAWGPLPRRAALPGPHPDPGAPSRARAAAASDHLMDLHAEVLRARCGGKGPWSPAQAAGHVWPSWVRTPYARKPQTLVAEALPPKPPGLRPPPSGGWKNRKGGRCQALPCPARRQGCILSPRASLDAARGDRGTSHSWRVQPCDPEPPTYQRPLSRLWGLRARVWAGQRGEGAYTFTTGFLSDSELEAPNRKLRSWGSSEGLRHAGSLVTEGQRESRGADPAPTLSRCPPAGLPEVLEEAGALLQGPKPGGRGGCDPESALPLRRGLRSAPPSSRRVPSALPRTRLPTAGHAAAGWELCVPAAPRGQAGLPGSRLPAPVLHAWLLMRVAAPPRQVRSQRQALSVLRPGAVHVLSTRGSPTAWRQPPSPDAPSFSAEAPRVWNLSPMGLPGPRPHPLSAGRAPTILGSNGPKGAVSASTTPGSVPSMRRAPGEAVPSGSGDGSRPPSPPGAQGGARHGRRQAVRAQPHEGLPKPPPAHPGQRSASISLSAESVPHGVARGAAPSPSLWPGGVPEELHAPGDKKDTGGRSKSLGPGREAGGPFLTWQ